MFETLTLTSIAIFALSWYYILGITLLSIIIILSIFNECIEFSLATLAIFFAILQYTGVIDIPQWNILAILTNISIYLVIGLFWSFFRYRLKAIAIIKDSAPMTQVEAIRKIKANISKYQISFWILFFPISILKFITEDLIDWLIEKFQGVYTLIAEYTVGSYLK